MWRSGWDIYLYIEMVGFRGFGQNKADIWIDITKIKWELIMNPDIFYVSINYRHNYPLAMFEPTQDECRPGNENAK